MVELPVLERQRLRIGYQITFPGARVVFRVPNHAGIRIDTGQPQPAPPSRRVK